MTTLDLPDGPGFHGPGDETSFMPGLVTIMLCLANALLTTISQAQITIFHLPDVSPQRHPLLVLQLTEYS